MTARTLVALVGVVLIGSQLCSAAESQASTGANYRGVTKCEGMQVEVSFSHDEVQSMIHDFTSSQSCLQGKGAVRWEAKKGLPVGPDGTFKYKDEHGNSVTGKIASGKASGDLKDGMGISIVCGDASHPFCKSWTADRAK